MRKLTSSCRYLCNVFL